MWKKIICVLRFYNPCEHIVRLNEKNLAHFILKCMNLFQLALMTSFVKCLPY